MIEHELRHSIRCSKCRSSDIDAKSGHFKCRGCGNEFSIRFEESNEAMHFKSMADFEDAIGMPRSDIETKK